MNISIIGGGYAGISAAIELSKHRDASVTLFDTRSAHQKITQWHKLTTQKAENYEIPFKQLAERFHFTFVQKTVDLSSLTIHPTLQNIRDVISSTLPNSPLLPPDAVIIAQGATSTSTRYVESSKIVTLDDLRNSHEAQSTLRNLRGKTVGIIGGGPTGVQFAFELARSNTVILFEAMSRLLPSFEPRLGLFAEQRALEHGIELQLSHRFESFNGSQIIAQNSRKESINFAVDYTLFVPGVTAAPNFQCDEYGRILVHDSVAQGLYACGDNSVFAGKGLNTKSAQSALRKGSLVAHTVLSDLKNLPAEAYDYQELGYFVSLGSFNAVGYLLDQRLLLRGPLARLMKEAVERQYDLFLSGWNTYF